MEVITQQTETMQHEVNELLAEMQKIAQSAPEPGDVRVGDVVSDGQSAEQPMPAVVSKVKSAGYVHIYDTLTGDRSQCNRNMLTMQLDKRRPDGSKVFSVVPPRDAAGNIVEPVKGTYKCMLHPDDPNRKQYDLWRLPVCTRENLASEPQVVSHMKARHKSEWAVIDGERERQERAEDRALQKEILMAAKEGQKKKG